jgi:hypothetical protein
MSYSAVVYNIMLSSPSDAEEERKTLRDCIYSWNDAHADQTEIFLHPLDYMNNVPSVSADIKDPRPQTVINDYIVEPSDWLIVIYKNTFGSSTGREDSGTMEEIKLFNKLKPQNPVSIYFYKDVRDRKIKKYKKDFPGFWAEYNDCQDLWKKFSIHLSQLISKNNCFQKNRIDFKRKIEARAQQLLIEIASDKNKLAFVSQSTGQELIINTNNCKYFGCEAAFELLCNKQYLEKVELKEDIFKLTKLGKQEIVSIKSFLSL